MQHDVGVGRVLRHQAHGVAVQPKPFDGEFVVDDGDHDAAVSGIEGPVDLNRHLIRDPTSTFIVRVSGDSMTGAGIFDGDEVIVDRSLDARDGSVVIAVVDNELTIKRLRLHGDTVRLVPENPAYPEIVLHELSELSIWGVVTRCLHRV